MRGAWFVLAADATSELVDVLGYYTWPELATMVRGGLAPEEILGGFVDETVARHVAIEMLSLRDSQGVAVGRAWVRGYVEALLASDGEGRR
jgi:hypothetical protein